jgi:hypothetical protein
MSVKELELITNTAILNFKYGTATNKFGIKITDYQGVAVIMLDRSQAHMIKLWLEEHLKADR